MCLCLGVKSHQLQLSREALATLPWVLDQMGAEVEVIVNNTSLRRCMVKYRIEKYSNY